METRLADFVRTTPAGQEAEDILRRCVHCGFCNATCPTYQLLGDELDGPRGRIYLIKQVLEGETATRSTQTHLDRCLHCRACETTCPSGVQYARLLDIGRAFVAGQVPRTRPDRLYRQVLRKGLSSPTIFAASLAVGRLSRPLLPASLKAKIPPKSSGSKISLRSGPPNLRPRRLIALSGCVQPALSPNINDAARRVLDRLGIQMIAADAAGCCGALNFHLDDSTGARAAARRNIDAWWPLLEAGAEGLVMTASGCGAHVRDYAYLLQDDPAYAVKAARVALLTRDISEVVGAESEQLRSIFENASPLDPGKKLLAFQSPCSLQHAQRIRGVVESLLVSAGFIVAGEANAHVCCGSAGAYSLLQKDISTQLRDNKLAALTSAPVATIVSANIGCITHLQSGTRIPVRHWIELISERMATLPSGDERAEGCDSGS